MKAIKHKEKGLGLPIGCIPIALLIIVGAFLYTRSITTIIFWLLIFGIIYLAFKILPKILPNISLPRKDSPEYLTLNKAVSIQNPYAGVFISGGAGAGKSKSIIEPIIKQAGDKKFTGIVYDFKFPELAQYVNTAYPDGGEIRKYFINFDDLNKSNRINPIAPEIMVNESFAREFAVTILTNLNPQMISKPDFWSDNATSLLTSIFWYLKKQHPDKCTLPHAISMVLQPNLEALLRTLSREPKCADMIAPILTAYSNKADNQIAGVVSSLQVSLSKINTDEIYYLLSKSDFNLDLNNPNSKGILVIGNNPTLASVYAPIAGLILTAVSKLLNQQGKEKSIFMVDEFPTVYVPNVEQLPATARSNKVATILACQDIAQIVDKYGRDKADTILSNLGNQFYGRTTNPTTAERVVKMFGREDKDILSEGRNTKGFETGYSKTKTQQERDLVKMQEVAQLQTGSFYTILSEGNERQGISAIPLDKTFTKTPILDINAVTNWDIEQAYKRIKNDIEVILR